MDFTHEDLELTFTIPDRPTVRQQLAYRGAIGVSSRPDLYLRHWEGVKQLIQDWECPHLDNPMTYDIDESDNPRAVDAIFWACNAVAGHMVALDDTPKN